MCGLQFPPPFFLYRMTSISYDLLFSKKRSLYIILSFFYLVIPIPYLPFPHRLISISFLLLFSNQLTPVFLLFSIYLMAFNSSLNFSSYLWQPVFFSLSLSTWSSLFLLFHCSLSDYLQCSSIFLLKNSYLQNLYFFFLLYDIFLKFTSVFLKS